MPSLSDFYISSPGALTLPVNTVTYNDGGTTNLDHSLGNVFSLTANGTGTTIGHLNVPSERYSFELHLQWISGNITWPTSWTKGDAAPTATGGYVITGTTVDGGISWKIGVLSHNLSLLMLYFEGEEYTTTTGGWIQGYTESTGWSFTKNTDNITLTTPNVNGTNVLARTTNTINFTNYNTLECELFTSNIPYAPIVSLEPSGGNIARRSKYWTTLFSPSLVLNNRTTFQFDVSAVTGNHYVCFGCEGANFSTMGGNFSLYSMQLIY